MKKLILMLSLLILPTLALADDDLTIEVGDVKEDNAVSILNSPIGGVLNKIPEMNNAIIYSINSHKIDYAAMFDAVQYKNAALSIGFSPNDAVVLGASLDFGALKDHGVDVPILKELGLKPMIFYSLNRINAHDVSNAEEGFGIGATLVSLKFW